MGRHELKCQISGTEIATVIGPASSVARWHRKAGARRAQCQAKKTGEIVTLSHFLTHYVLSFFLLFSFSFFFLPSSFFLLLSYFFFLFSFFFLFFFFDTLHANSQRPFVFYDLRRRRRGTSPVLERLRLEKNHRTPLRNVETTPSSRCQRPAEVLLLGAEPKIDFECGKVCCKVASGKHVLVADDYDTFVWRVGDIRTAWERERRGPTYLATAFLRRRRRGNEGSWNPTS